MNAKETLMGLEAKTRQDYERMLARRRRTEPPAFDVVAFQETPGLRFVVAYHPLRSWSYEFTAPEGGLRGKFDSRDSCLTALAAHMAVNA